MTQTNNRLLDEFAKLMTDAVGAAQGAQRDVNSFMRSQGERMMRDWDIVQREEFEAVKAMAAAAREENVRLGTIVTALTARLDALEGRQGPAAPSV